MARKLNEELKTTWRDRVQRQRRSGLSIAEFCRREGISSVSFYWWKRKLGKSTAANGGANGSGNGPNSVRRTSLGSATSSCDFVALPITSTRISPWIDLTLIDGTIVRVPQHNLQALTTVLRLLRDDQLNSHGLGANHA